MKIIIMISLLLTLLAMILPIILAPVIIPDPPISKEPSQKEPQNTGSSLYYDPNTETSAFDDSFSITLLCGGSTTKISLTDYLIGAVSAEMPASFSLEALKAQSVALRTYLLHKITVSPSSAHPEADICSDSTCCAAWKDETFLREKWGADFDKNFSKIKEAVTSTDGLYLSYEDSPALAVFHSSSAGKTEASSAVWSSSLPYLISVSSPENTSSVPNYVTTLTLSTSEFKELFLAAFPDASFSDSPENWLGDVTYTSSGRVDSITVASKTISGTQLRSVFSLRSTAVTIEFADDAFTLTSTGYGHGVGMSQYGANVMAQNGSKFSDILANYYPGTALSSAAESNFLS